MTLVSVITDFICICGAGGLFCIDRLPQLPKCLQSHYMFRLLGVRLFGSWLYSVMCVEHLLYHYINAQVTLPLSIQNSSDIFSCFIKH